MKYLRPPISLLKGRMLGILLPLALPLTLSSQVDLYIAGDIVLSGINDTLHTQGNVIYNAGKINYHRLEISKLSNTYKVDLNHQIAGTTGDVCLTNARRTL